MDNFLLQFHSGWRYIVITVLVVAIVKLLLGLVTNGKWGALDQKLGVATPIILDIQLLLGIVLFGVGAAVRTRTMGQIGEHLTIMIIAAVIAHIGWARAKKSDVDADKFRAAGISYLVAGLLVGLGIARITGYM